MNILLAYSTHHFQPGEERGRASASSAATLARALYTHLSEWGEVEYVDGLKPPKRLKRKHYDILVGIQGSLTPLSRKADFDKIVLFAVNMHPAARNRILHDFNEQYHVCSAKHVARNSVHLRQMDDIERADAVLLVGNATIARSFLAYGTSLRQLRHFNYTSALPCREKAKECPNTPPKLLYVATEMCLRKGFDVLFSMLEQVQDMPFVCGIIGGAGDTEYREKLANLQAKMGSKLKVHGWVDSSTPAYMELLQSYDVVVFPSLEEGQAGSVLDAMSQGLIPLITRQTGVDYAPLGFLEPAVGSAHNEVLLRRVLALGRSELQHWQATTLAWYRRHHAGWETTLHRALEAMLHTGIPWPDESEYRTQEVPIAGNWRCEMADKLEQVPELSAVAMLNPGDAVRMQWTSVDTLPENCVVLSRGEPMPPYLLGVPDAQGVDVLSAPLALSKAEKSGYFYKLRTLICRVLGWIHPSKQQRKLCYNAWRLSSVPYPKRRH